MMRSKKIQMVSVILLAGGLYCSASTAAIAGNTNQVDFALISDPHVDIDNYKAVNINPNGTYKGADLDKPSFITLISKLSNSLSQLPENPSFVAVLGDLPSHNASKIRSKALNVVFQNFYEQLNPMPIFYSFGNNDSTQRNYGPFKSNGNSAYEIFKNVTGKGGFLSSGNQCPYTNQPCVINKNEDYGFYSAYVGDHLKLISLNSVIFVSRPGFSPSRDGDKEQLQWLRSELAKSQANKEQVILTMHVAPNSWMPEYKSAFKDIINSYPNVVIGMMAAHSHYDELRVIKTAKQTIPIIFSAGLSTGHGNSASFKTISIGRETNTSRWAIENYTTYYFKGYKADSSSVEKYYDFKTAFCSQDGDSFGLCLNKHIVKSQKDGGYVFTYTAGKLLSQHYYANPAVPGNVNASKWVMNY